MGLLVDPDAAGVPAQSRQATRFVDDLIGSEICSGGSRESLSRKAVDDRQNPERPRVEMPILHESMAQISLTPPASGVIDLPAFALMQHMQAAIAVAHARLNQFIQAKPERRLRVAHGSMALESPSETARLTRPTLRNRTSLAEMPNHFATTNGLHFNFRRASCSMILSRIRSAISRFSFEFSSSSCFCRRISATPIPA